MQIAPIISVALLAGAAFAQQPADSTTVLKSSTREVLLEAVVRDSHGRMVTKIDPSQVEVYEDGVRQQIRSFRLVRGQEVRAQDEQRAAQAVQAPAAPGVTPISMSGALRMVRIICLVLNDLTPDTRNFAFQNAKKFLDKELRPDTFIAVFTLDGTGVRPVISFSNNRDRLVKAIELAAINQLPALAETTGAMLNGLSSGTVGATLGINGAALNGLTIGLSGVHMGAEGNADGSSPQDPLGTRGDMGLASITGMREIEALKKLVTQLSALPFQKTVLLMSTGLTRPPDQIDYWNSMIRAANKGGVTFYAMDAYGLGVCQDSSADCGTSASASGGAVAFLNKVASLSAGQSKVGSGAGQITPRQGGGVNVRASDTAQLMESMHQTDYLRFGILSANTQEALRELAESTGGFLIANTNNTEKLLAKVMDDVDTHYEISYRPASDREDGHFRKIEVKLSVPKLEVQTRNGYFAVPETGNSPLSTTDLIGLRVLDTRPRPHAFNFQSKAFHFRSAKGTPEYAIAFQVPIANLTATPETAHKMERFHASLLALVKNAKGEVVDRVSKDVSSTVSDDSVTALRTDSMTYEHAVMLAPGHCTVETAVVDHEGNHASTNVFEIDNQEKPGLALSDIALVHRVQDLDRPPAADDPFEIPGKRASPFVSGTLAQGADPFIYFVIYVDKSSPDFPGLQAQFLKDVRVLATQKAVLPAPDESGSIPMTIRAVREPGNYEVKIAVEQGHTAVERSLKYSVAAK